MEYLYLLIEEEIQLGNWKLMKIRKQGPHVTHNPFTCDIVIFCMNEDRIVDIIQCVLQNFCAILR